MTIEITLYAHPDSDNEGIREALTPLAVKAFRRETKSRRQVSIYRWNEDSRAMDGSYSVWKGSLIGRAVKGGGHPVLAEVWAYVYSDTKAPVLTEY